MTVTFNVSGADPGTSSAGVTGGPGTLSYAIAQVNASDPAGGPYVINLTGNVALSGPDEGDPFLGSRPVFRSRFRTSAERYSHGE